MFPVQQIHALSTYNVVGRNGTNIRSTTGAQRPRTSPVEGLHLARMDTQTARPLVFGSVPFALPAFTTGNGTGIPINVSHCDLTERPRVKSCADSFVCKIYGSRTHFLLEDIEPMEPQKFLLCRIRDGVGANDGTSSSPVLLSTHGYVWAETSEQAARLVLGTRTPAIPLPKGRPPVNTSLCMLSEAHVAAMQASVNASVAVTTSEAAA